MYHRYVRMGDLYHRRGKGVIIIINYFYNAHNTLQGMSLCAVRKKRLGGGTVQVHDIRDN